MGDMRCVRLALSLCLVAATPGLAVAEEQIGPVDGADGGELGPSYLWDGGALPFVWGALAARIAVDTYAVPRQTPLAFDPSEGGAEPSSWQIPGWSITALGGVSAVGMIASRDRSRSYHVKGLTQALSTGVLVTGIVKVTFGRHRPDWDPEVNSAGSRRSFPSGHATQAFAVATYTILYLHGHYFDRNEKLTLGEAATYGAITLGAAALAGERVLHSRHHLSDVTIGGLLGATASTLFYVYQERRFRDQERRQAAQLAITPSTNGALIGIATTW